MAMNKTLLFNKVKEELIKKKHKIDFDLPLVLYLIKKTIFNDPKINCIIKGKTGDWEGLPETKSLFHAKQNCGLPIGNLTSQLFGNIYMNEFDHWVKRDLGIKYYGRYVDDFLIVHQDKDYLKSLTPVLSNFLLSTLQLTLHPKKIYLQHCTKGVQFLGTVIKPNRIYIANRTKGNFYHAIEKQNKIARDHKPDSDEQKAFLSSMNSYLGIMKHYKTYNLRKQMIFKNLSGWWWNYAFLSGGISKFVLKEKPAKRQQTKKLIDLSSHSFYIVNQINTLRMKIPNHLSEKNIQPPSLRFQAHTANPTNQSTVKVCGKSLQARPCLHDEING
jgi:hypothetical protein